MKKYLFFAAAATLAACTQDTLIDESRVPEAKDAAIGFATGTNNLTRAENDYQATGTKGLEKYHKDFRIWGYKNIATSENNVYKNEKVFAGWNDPYSVITYDATAVSVDGPYDKGWTYEPLRYWDKTATNYEFHAAAPATPGNYVWTWTEKENTATGATSATTDGKGAGNFSIENVVLKNNSLGLDYEVCGQTRDVFQDEDGRNIDLMIADDVKEHKSYTKDAVQFNFNHILSRMNIGVRLGEGVAVIYDQTATVGDVKYNILLSNLDAYKGKEYVRKVDGKYYELTETSGTYTIDDKTGREIDEGETFSNKQDETKPEKGIVVLEEVLVYNLNNKGTFNEDTTQQVVKDEKNNKLSLHHGLTSRWTTQTEKVNSEDVLFGFPNDSVLKETDIPFSNGTKATGWNLSKNVTVDRYDLKKELKKGDYKMLYQGLIMPQVAGYESLDVTGKDLKETGAKPYMKICYSIDGEKFINYYNLASIFSNTYDIFKYGTEEVKVAKTTDATDTYIYTKDGSVWYTKIECTDSDKKDGVIAYKNGDTYTNAGGTTIYYDAPNDTWYAKYENDAYSEPITGTENIPTIIILGTKDSHYLTRGEAQLANIVQAKGECDIKLCEGWQNDIWITIDPTRIIFDAEVYKWADKYTSGYPENTDKGNESMKKVE